MSKATDKTMKTAVDNVTRVIKKRFGAIYCNECQHRKGIYGCKECDTKKMFWQISDEEARGIAGEILVVINNNGGEL